MFKKNKKIENYPETDTLKVTVVGQYYHMDTINSFTKKNPLYKKNSPQDGSNVYKYIYKEAKAELVPNGNNIKVGYGGKLIGYVAEEQIPEVLRILQGPYKLSARIYGGEYKIWLDNSQEWFYADSNIETEYILTYPKK